MAIAQQRKRTPCVGICSTTYGDLVCRGCKRFAHEIVQWNGYDEAQQSAVWGRLHALRDEVVAQRMVITDPARYAAACTQAGLDDAQTPGCVYALVNRLVADAASDIGAAGLRLMPESEAEALAVMRALEADIYQRSLAHYERSFKISV